MFRRLLSRWFKLSENQIDIKKIQSLKVEDDDIVFIEFSEDATLQTINSFREAYRKHVGIERNARTILHIGELKVRKINMKENVIDKIILGDEG